MNVSINEEFQSEEDLSRFLSDEGYLVESEGEVIDLYINKFLRDDKSINLELLEFAVKSSCESGIDVLVVSGYNEYVLARDIVLGQDSTRQEFDFIRFFIRALVEEYSDKDVELICLTP